MARIPYDQTAPFGSKIYLSVQAIKNAQAYLERCIDQANVITGDGRMPQLLEITNPNQEAGKQFGVAEGEGQNFYDAIKALNEAIAPGGRALPASVDLDHG
jgi:hypothetical protein